MSVLAKRLSPMRSVPYQSVDAEPMGMYTMPRAVSTVMPHQLLAAPV